MVSFINNSIHGGGERGAVSTLPVTPEPTSFLGWLPGDHGGRLLRGKALRGHAQQPGDSLDHLGTWGQSVLFVAM